MAVYATVYNKNLYEKRGTAKDRPQWEPKRRLMLS